MITKLKRLFRLLGAGCLLLICCRNPAESPVDVDPPSVSISFPQNGDRLKEPTIIKVKAQDNSAITEVLFFAGRDSLGRDSSPPYEHYWNINYWVYDQEHTLVAKAVDKFGNVGQSEPVTVTILRENAHSPELQAPQDSALIVNTNEIKLKCRAWPDAWQYEFQVSTTPDFSVIEVSKAVKDTSVTTMALDPGWHFWRARAQNAQQRWTSWSIIWSFKINGPAPPRLLTPSNGEIITDTNRPILQWKTAKHTLTYQVVLSSLSDFSRYDFLHSTSDTFALPPTLSQQSFYWKVRGQNAIGILGDWSPVRQFRIDGPLPPRLLSPRNDTVNSDDYFMSLSWNSSLHAALYECEVSFYPDFSRLRYALSLSDTVTTALALPYGIHYWRVRARNKVSYGGAWSPAQRFGIGEIFAKTHGGGQRESGAVIQQTTDGGYIIVGSTNSFGAGDENLWLVKIQSSGKVEWERTFGGAGFEYGTHVEQTTDRGYILVGTTFSTESGHGDIFLVKTDGAGAREWTRTFGGSFTDLGRGVQQTPDGGFIICGSRSTGTTGSYQVWLIKTDAFGNKQWENTYYQGDLNIGQCVLMTIDGGYLIGGTGRANGTFLIKTDSNGKQEWLRNYRGEMRSVNHVRHPRGYILAGMDIQGDSDAFLLSVDLEGRELWMRTYGGNLDEGAACAQQTPDAGYLFVGFTRSTGSGSSDLWIVRTNAEGQEQWSHTYGGSGSDGAQYVQTTRDGGFIIVGNTDSYGAGGSDMWIIKTDSKGETIF